MINDRNRWTVGWIDWNLLLDEQGGPNHVGHYCSAPVLADVGNGALLHQSFFRYLGHSARFVQPGARRVLCAATVQALECTALSCRRVPPPPGRPPAARCRPRPWPCR